MIKERPRFFAVTFNRGKTMQIDLLQATEDDLPIVHNLVSYCVYEISGPMGWEFASII